MDNFLSLMLRLLDWLLIIIGSSLVVGDLFTRHVTLRNVTINTRTTGLVLVYRVMRRIIEI